MPWFIFSAKYGLLAPDDVVASYELKITTLSAAERRALGRRVVEDLERRVGGLSEVVVEAHAGNPYVNAIRDELAKRRAVLRTPLTGIVGTGAQIGWYKQHPGDEPSTPARPSAGGSTAPSPRRLRASKITRGAGRKYAPLTEYLRGLPHPAHVSFAEIDRLVGGLPKSADLYPAWWANHARNPQAKGWLAADRRVESVDLARRVVEFS